MSNNVGSSTVDQRIVEMRIDNEKFEAGAKKTISILESLDRSLKGVGEENAEGFDSIGKSLDKVTDRFSAMGIVGDQVIRNLTNQAMNLVNQMKHVATSLTTQQVGAGWDKYAGKVQAVQTIMAATNSQVGEGLKWADQEAQLEGVSEQLERLTWFADETSYSFSDMVNNVGKFTAAGRDLEESVTAMQGISAWAAISGGRPSEAGRAMYNLSQALGLGAVTTIDWKSIELANMATFEFKKQVIELAEQMGTLKKVADDTWETAEGHTVTIESFRENLKDKWFNSDVLLAVLNKYGGFAQLVADVQEGFGYDSATYVLSDLKEYEESLKTAGEAEKFLKRRSQELGVSFDTLKDAMEMMLQPEYDLGRRAFQAAQEAKTFQEVIDATKDAVSTKWMTVFELLFGNYMEAKELWTQMAETFWGIFAKPVDRLIEIIEGARGLVTEEGIFPGMVESSASVNVLNDRLSKVGKTMEDFKKAIYSVSDRQTLDTIENFNTIEEALMGGAISADLFKKALGALDDTYGSEKTVGLNRALNKAGKSMDDFEEALKKTMDPKAVVKALNSYSSIEEAFRNGAISVDDFKKALESLGIDSENVAATVEDNMAGAAAGAAYSLEEMRKFALEVLRGDHGNGAERRAWYESMGLDAELMQAMAGDLMWGGYNMSDEKLMEWMEQYYNFNNLKERLGYDTFAEYLASLQNAVGNNIYNMEDMAEEAEDIYASLFGEGVLSEMGEFRTAGELFRESLSNLLTALDNIGTAFDKAFLRVFGGGGNYDNQIGKMSDGFFTLSAALWSFSNRVKAFTESEGFLNFATAMLSVLRLIGKAIGLIFKIGKIVLNLALKLLSPILKLVTSLFEVISLSIDTMSRSLEDLGLTELIDAFGNDILDKIGKPIEKICEFIDELVSAFREGLGDEENGGIAGGIQRMSEKLNELLADHPVLLSVLNALGTAFAFLRDVVSGLAMALGTVFGGAVMVVVGVFSQLGEWFSQFVTWASESELLTAAWKSITEAFDKFGKMIRRVYGYAEQGYQNGGFLGAFTAVLESLERGITRIIPGGEKIVELFQTIRSAIGGLFKEKKANDDGTIELIDAMDTTAARLERFTRDVADGAFGDDKQQAGFRERVKTFVGNLWEGFLEGLRDIRVGDVINALRLGVIADIVLKVGHGLNIINQLGENIREIPENISWTIENIALTFKSLSVDFKANAILKFAIAAGIVAGAIWVLSKIPDKNLEKASSVVISILAVLSLLAAALGKTSASIFQTIQYMPALGAALIGFAAVVSSIGMTALILVLLAKFVGVDKLQAAAFVIMTVLVTIGILIAGIIRTVKNGNFNSFQIKAIGSMLARMAIGLIGLAAAAQMLSMPILAFCAVLKFIRGKQGLGKFALAVGSVLALLVVIGVMVWVMASAVNGYTAEQISNVGTYMIKIAASMMILAFAINMLTLPIILLAAAQKILKLNINGIVGAITVFAILGLLFTLVLAAFSGSMANKQEAQIKAVGDWLLKFAASLLIISLGVRLLMKPIIAIANLSKQLETKHILGAFALLVLTLTALAGLLALISKIVLKGKGGSGGLGLGKGLMRIAEGILLLSLAALVLTPAIILMTAAIAGFAWVLGSLSDDTWKVFEEGLTRLSKFSGKLFWFGAALLVVGLGTVAVSAGLVSIAAGILLFAAAMAIIMFALPKFIDMLKDLKETSSEDLWKSIKKISLAMGGFMLILFLTVTALNGLFRMLGGGRLRLLGDCFVKMISGLANSVRTGVSNGFTKVIAFLKDEKNKEALLIALRGVILLAATYVAGLLPTLADVIVGGIVGLINAVSASVSNQAPAIVDALHNLVEALVKVGAALIDDVFGTNLLTKLNESETALNTVTGIVEGLGLLVAGLSLTKPFQMLITKLKGKGGVTDSIGGVSSVASQVDDALIALTGSSESYFTSLIKGIGPYIGVVGALALAIAGVAKGMNDLKNGEGWWSSVKEAEDAQNVERFGKADVTVQEQVEGLDSVIAKTKEYNDELKRLQAEQDAEFEMNGWTEKAEELQNQIDAQLARIQKYEIENEGLFARMATAITGETSGTDYNAVLAMIKDGTIETSEAYQEFIKTQAAVGESTTETATELGTAGAASEKFASKAGSASTTTVEKTEEVTAAVEETTTAVEKTGSAFDWLKEKISSADLTGGLLNKDKAEEAIKSAFSNQGFDISDFMFADGGFDVSKIKSQLNIDQLKSDISASLNEAGMYSAEGFGEGVESTDLGEYVGGFKGSFLDILWMSLGISSPSTVMRDEVGIYIPAGIGEGIKANQAAAISPLGVLVNNMLKTFTTVKANFIAMGGEIVKGLAFGISDNSSIAYSAGQNLAASLETGFRERLLIESPSKVFENLAGYIPAGITQGIQDGQGGAIESVVVLGDALIEAIMQSMAMVSTVANDEFDLQPHITPVVDLSNVTSAAGAMGSAFSGNYRVSAQMSNAINSRMGDVERLANAMRSSQTVNQGDQITFNIYQQPGQNADELAEVVMQRMSTRFSRRGAAFG